MHRYNFTYPYTYNDTYVYIQQYDSDFDSCPPSLRRSAAGALWSLTATYIAALSAHAHLQRNLQSERSQLKVVYNLLIFIFCPLYPVGSLLWETCLALWTWRRQQHTKQPRTPAIYLVARIIGLQAARSDGSSEPLSPRHLWLGTFVSRSPRGSVFRIGHAVGLAFASVQCLGTLVRCASRIALMDGKMEALLLADFEAFFLSIGAVGILVKAWLAFGVNVEWKGDDGDYVAGRSKALDILSPPVRRRGGLFVERDSHVSLTEVVAELFFEPFPRLVILATLCFIWSVVLMSLRVSPIFLLVSWLPIALPALFWLRSADIPAVPGGKELAFSGFAATLILLIPRFLFYRVKIRDTEQRYFYPLFLPWPLVLLAAAVVARVLLLGRQRRGAALQASSHLGIVALGALLIVVLPAFWFSAVAFEDLERFGGMWCPAEVRQDPFYTPGF